MTPDLDIYRAANGLMDPDGIGNVLQMTKKARVPA